MSSEEGPPDGGFSFDRKWRPIFLLVVAGGTTGALLIDSQWMLGLWAAGEKKAEDPPVHARLT